MFEALTDRLNRVFRKIKGRGLLTEKNISQALREIRTALLEADVNHEVVKEFIEHVKQRAVGREVTASITPGQQVVKIVHDELIKLLGPVDHDLNLQKGGMSIIMMVGLNGSGKTTSSAKIAVFLKKRGYRPALVGADPHRPAALEQLRQVGEQAGIPVFGNLALSAVDMSLGGVEDARLAGHNVAIVDTAGRLQIDEELMRELEDLQKTLAPHQVLLVCDAMIGQESVNVAKGFASRLRIDGMVLTKMDGDARGGAALSVKAATGIPVKFVGTGEKPNDLELFYPDRMASRILGMGDVVTLVEKAQETIDRETATRIQRKVMTAEFTLEDFLESLQQVRKMGPLKDILKMIPGASSMPMADVDEKELVRVQAMIQSMTREERRKPDIIDTSRQRRIARGSGTSVQDVRKMLKEFKMVRKMFKQMKGSGKKRRKGVFPWSG